MFNINNFIDQIEPISTNLEPHFPTLNIALGFDNNYAMPAGVAILSVIQNTPNCNLHFHLFIDNVSHVNLEKFKNFNYQNL